MPFLARALLEKRARFQRWADRMGLEALIEKHPAAEGYLRPDEGYRLMERREELCQGLLEEIRSRQQELESEPVYPLAPL